MEKHRYGLPRIFSIIIFLGLVSFVSCIVAEFKTTKKKDIKLDGKRCYLPGSPQAFGFGITALICLTIAQILGNLVICRQQFCSSSGEKRSSCGVNKKPTISTLLLFISWISFGTAIIIISAATSMNTRQHYGKGWLDGKCFIAKEGVYAAAAVLVLVTIGSTLGSSITAIRKSQVEQKLNIHAQSG